jgi:hypothetical protein
VNIALFSSSAWHLGRKIKADYIDDEKKVIASTAITNSSSSTTINSLEEE